MFLGWLPEISSETALHTDKSCRLLSSPNRIWDSWEKSFVCDRLLLKLYETWTAPNFNLFKSNQSDEDVARMRIQVQCHFPTPSTLFFLSLFVNFCCPSEVALLWEGCDLLKFENLCAKERPAEKKMRNNASSYEYERKMLGDHFQKYHTRGVIPRRLCANKTPSTHKEDQSSEGGGH